MGLLPGRRRMLPRRAAARRTDGPPSSTPCSPTSWATTATATSGWPRPPSAAGTGVLAVARAYRSGRRKAFCAPRPCAPSSPGTPQLYLRTSQSVSRRQELAADRMAARIAGRGQQPPRPCVRCPRWTLAYGFYLDRYAAIGWDAGLLAAARGVLPAACTRCWLGAQPAARTRRRCAGRAAPGRARPPTTRTRPSPSGSPPSSPCPDDGRVAAGAEPAGAHPAAPSAAQVCAHVAAAALPPEAAAERPVDWDELARGAGRAAAGTRRRASVLEHRLRRAAARRYPNLSRAACRPSTPAGWTLIAASPAQVGARPAGHRPGRAGSSGAPPSGTRSPPPALLALVDGGRARWTHSWARTLHLEYGRRRGEDAAAAALDRPGRRGRRTPGRSARLLHGLPPAPAMSPDADRTVR